MSDMSNINKKIVVQLCPRCRKNYFTPYGEEYVDGVSPPFAALSRLDNTTYVCSECGVWEALNDIPRR